MIDRKGDVVAVVLLFYRIKATMQKNNALYSILTRYLILTPFIYIIIFTNYYSNEISRDINRPLDQLRWASENIKNQNLDFEIKTDYKNEVGELLLVFEDMRQSLKKSLEEQWISEEMRRENLSNIAHDLKTPLTIINTYLEVIASRNLEERRQEEYLKIVRKNTERAIGMVEDMNSLSRLENQEFKLRPVELDIAEFLGLKLDEFKLLSARENIDYSFEILDGRKDKDLKGYYDGEYLTHVIENIISNSINHSGTPKIEAELSLEDHGFTMDIRDYGRGFSEEDLENLFNKFYRGDKARGSKAGNTGLGLFIAKRIVELHGGWIRAYNAHGGGALVSLYIRELR